MKELINPLLENFNTPYASVPFDIIKEEHFLPALKEAIKIRNEHIEKVKAQKNPNFVNTIQALDNSSHLLDAIANIFFNLQSANTNDNMDKLAKEFSPILTEAQNDLVLDQKLFLQIEKVKELAKKNNLNPEQMRLLDKYYKSFVRNGARLNDSDKVKLRAIDKKLSELSLKFSENSLKETNNYFLHLKNEQEVEGLPKGVLDSASEKAAEKKLTGWVFTLQYPSYLPFMQYAKNEDLRKEIYMASGQRAHKNNEFNNDNILKEIAHLRFQRATLLGYQNHADYVLEERMAQSKEKVFGLLNNLLEKCNMPARKELEELKILKKELTGKNEFHPWDYLYYFEKLKEKKFKLSDEMLKPFFKLENVIDGVFLVASKLYDLNFKMNKSIPRYHEEVEVYEVSDKNTGEFIGLFYTDFFPRDGKRSGAWMTSYSEQFTENGKDHRPHISIVCNFTKPTKQTPSLLTLDEVRTLFHEFGHALHGLLSKCNYKTLSGTNVLWDFVELPSQIMENWVYEKECLDLFAKHYQTGEKLPIELIQKIRQASNFHEGIATLRQISLGLLDLSWHTQDIKLDVDVESFESKATEKCQLYPKVPGISTSTSFGHIFSGGYSAGYYSYKWAEVLDADAFEYFKENGIFNSTIAKKFKECVLSKGDSDHPMDLYKAFRGQEPSPDALLRRAGLI